jgi:hypothetical protein
LISTCPAHILSRSVFCTNERTSYKFSCTNSEIATAWLDIKPSTSCKVFNSEIIHWSMVFRLLEFRLPHTKTINIGILRTNRYCIKFQRIFCAPQQFLLVFQVVPRIRFDIIYQRVASGPYSFSKGSAAFPKRLDILSVLSLKPSFETIFCYFVKNWFQ